MSTLKDKVVLISGVNCGLGQAIAVHLASLGSYLSLTGRNLERLQHTADLCLAAGATHEHILIVKGTVVKENTVKGLVDKTLARYGRLDVLINNVGIAVCDDIETTSLEHFDMTFNANVRGPFHLTMVAIPYLLHSKGSIVNISSSAGTRPMSELLTFGMSKAALDHFTRTLAAELRPKGVRVNSISLSEVESSCPSCVDLAESDTENPCGCRAFGHYETSGSVVKVIAFLASSEAGAISGSVLPVEGGWHCVT